MNGDTVGLAYMAAGVHDIVGKVAVIGEKKQSLGVAVKPSHGIYTLVNACKQLGNALSVQLVCHGGNISTGLVEHNVYLSSLLGVADSLAAYHDNVTLVCLVAQLCLSAVDIYLACADKLLRFSA